MCVWTLNLVIFLLPRLIQGMLVGPVVYENCDGSTILVPEGSLVEADRVPSHFPWIGVLRPLRPKLQSNLLRFGKGGTMVILVRDMFAIGVADELMRLPKYLFKGFASIMFQYRGSRSYKMISCIPHPEYDEDAEEGTTVNAMALLKVQPLDPGDLVLRGPIVPVCLRRNIDAERVSDQLYAVLYNKINFTFEKTIYSMKYMQKELCHQFYNQGGLTEEGFEPISMQCAHTRQLTHSCVWESGVALISNATGPWILVGLGTKSLGCGNPTRFIDMTPYIPWIEAVTTSDKWKDVLNRRLDMESKGHLRQGFKQRPPAMQIDTSPPVSTALPEQHRVIQGMYPFDVDLLHNPFGIYQKDKSKMAIFPIPGDYGQCTDARNEIIYRDNTQLISPEDAGSMTYRLTMYDDAFQTVSCTKVELEALFGDDAVVYAADEMHMKAGAAFRDLGDTPEEVLNRVYMNPVVKPPPFETDPEKWIPGPPMKVVFLTDTRNIVKKKTHNIYLRLFFDREAMLHITVLGIRTPTTTKAPTTTKSARRRFGGGRARNNTRQRVVTGPPRRFPIEENEEDFSGSKTTWRPVKRTTKRPIRPTRRRSSNKRPNVEYELYNIAPETALLKSAAAVTRIQLVLILITVFATWMLYVMHFT